MIPNEIQCQNCGWRNEPTARMCGGCGKPLQVVNTPGGLPFGEQTTDPELTAVGPKGKGVAAGPPPLKSGATRSTVATRVLVIVSVVVLALACVLLGVWALVIQPAIHRTVDTALRSQLDAVVSQTAAAAVIPSGSYSLTAAQVADALNGPSSGQIPVQNVVVHFANGTASVDYTVFGTAGSVSTHPTAENGVLVFKGTTVSGLLAVVESGGDVESALNSATAKLGPNLKVTTISAANDTLQATITNSAP